MRLFKYDCGCIGFGSRKEGEDHILISTCDSESGELCIVERSMVNRTITARLEKHLAQDIQNEMRELIIDGYKFRRIKQLLD